MQTYIMKNMILKKIKDIHGQMIPVFALVILMVIVPMLAVVYDLSMMRMIQQDMKNIQDIALVSCRVEHDNKVISNCESLVYDLMRINTGYPVNHYNELRTWLAKVPNGDKYTTGRYLKGSQRIAMMSFHVGRKGDNMEAQMCATYRPVFLVNSVFNSYDKGVDIVTPILNSMSTAAESNRSPRWSGQKCNRQSNEVVIYTPTSEMTGVYRLSN